MLPVERAGRARLFIGIWAGCLIVFALLYGLAERTAWGQRLGNAALTGQIERPRVRNAVEEVLNTISVSSLALLGLAIMAIALWRGRVQLALAAGTVIVGANITTQLLKKVVLTRPELVAPPRGLPEGNVFPSGHTTVAMSLAMALILVTPARLRSFAVLAGGGYATIVGVGVLTAGWHRPSDAIGANLVVAAWAAAAAAFLVISRGTGRREYARRWNAPALIPTLAAAGAVVLAAAFLVLAGLALALHRGRLNLVKFDLAFAAGAAAIAGTGVLLIAVILGALRGVNLDEPTEH